MANSSRPKPGAIHHLIVHVLTQHPGGLWHGELREILQRRPYSLAPSDQAHLARRMRELPLWWAIKKTPLGNRVRYSVTRSRKKAAVIGAPSPGIGKPPIGPTPFHQTLATILRASRRGLTSGEMRAVLQNPPFSYTPAQQTQVDRRMRELPNWYPVKKVRVGVEVRCTL